MILRHTQNLNPAGIKDKIIEFLNMGILDFSKIKFFLGYSGWTSDQLINEFDSNSWIAAEESKNNVFSKNNDLWKDVLIKSGGKLKAIANFPLNPIDK